MDNIKINKCFVLFVLITSVIAQIVLAFPVLPSQFYGDIVIDGKYANIGTNISVYDIDGILCGSFTVKKEGEYIISCKGDNPKTIEDEGAKENEPLNFYFNDRPIESKARWHAEGFTRLDIIIKTENETMQNVEYPSKEKKPIEMYLISSLFLAIIIFIIVRLRKL